MASLEAYGTTAHHGMTSPEHALHRGRTPSLESMDDEMSHITFETAPFHLPDSSYVPSHAELKSWHTSLHNESGGARSLAIYGELRLREALMLNGDDKPHSVMAAVSGDLLLKLTTLYRRFGNFTRLLTETQLRCVFADYDHIIAPELSRGVTRATLGRATPWFDVASQLKARLVACKATASRNREVVERWRRKYDNVAKNRALRAWRLHVRHAKVVRRLRLKLYLRAWLLVATKNARRRQACAMVLKDALQGADGQDRVELAWAAVEQEPMRTGKENFTLGYETGVDAVATDAAMAEMVEEDFNVSFGDLASQKIEELPSPKEEEGGFLDTLASQFDGEGEVVAVDEDVVDIVRGWGPPPPRLDDETDEAYQERLRKGGYACWLPAEGESMDQWRRRIAKATPLHGETDAQWLLRMVPDVADKGTQTLLRGDDDDDDDDDEDDGFGRRRRKRHSLDSHEKRRRRLHKQACARRAREHHELGLHAHGSRRHGTHSVRGMPIQQVLQLIPALLEEALRADVTAAVHEARARGDALVASLVAAAAAAKPFRTLAMTACVRRFGMRNLAVKKLRAVVATCRDETARARHARLELFAVLLGLTPAHKSNCHGASHHGSIMGSTPSTRRQLDGVAVGVSQRSIRSAQSHFRQERAPDSLVGLRTG